MRISALKKVVIEADDLVEAVISEVATGKRVVIKGLGTFYPVPWETRNVRLLGRNKVVRGRNIVMFRASRVFKDRVKRGE